MTKLFVIAVPRFAPGESETLERLRAQHDPQATLVPAHVTLVFGRPEAEAEELVARVRAQAAEQGPITITLSGARIAVEEHAYLFLLVQEGRAPLERLYLALNDDPRPDFAPHVTLGHFEELEKAEAVAAEAGRLNLSGVIDSLQVENVLHGKLHRIATVPLGRAPEA